ncbi:hypothetical protein HA402_005522 [Bradysia odoriphaga]|nr:hypothetical protein HA402_005522 [Bradysia odoriphaga]
METWMRISLLLCVYGFFREFRPSDSFLTVFLSGEWRNVTAEDVTKEVYPYATYSYLSQLVVAFLITDMLRYKPLIVVSACFGIVIWIMLLWTKSLGALQTVEVFYGTYMATEVAYYTYIYAKVERDKYQQVTGFTKAAVLCARFLAGVVAQLLVSFHLMDLRELNYISLGSQIISLAWALSLPAVGGSMYFHTPTENHLPRNSSVPITLSRAINPTDNRIFTQDGINWMKFRRAWRLLWNHFTISYSNPVVIQWSFWWALAMCGFMQVQLYIQFLWQQINPDHANIYNGAVEALLTILGALGAFAAGYLDSKKFDRWDLWILTLCSTIEGCTLIWGALTDSVWISYVAYVIFGTIYYFMITVASVNIAKKLLEDSFAMVFAFNTMAALMFQTLLTVAVISESGFELKAREQFVVYGGYFIALAVVYGITSIVSSIKRM